MNDIPCYPNGERVPGHKPVHVSQDLFDAMGVLYDWLVELENATEDAVRVITSTKSTNTYVRTTNLAKRMQDEQKAIGQFFDIAVYMDRAPTTNEVITMTNKVTITCTPPNYTYGHVLAKHAEQYAPLIEQLRKAPMSAGSSEEVAFVMAKNKAHESDVDIAVGLQFNDVSGTADWGYCPLEVIGPAFVIDVRAVIHSLGERYDIRIQTHDDASDAAAGVDCLTCGKVDLSKVEYERQLSNSDALWCCPICGEVAQFDDARFEALNGIDQEDEEPDYGEEYACVYDENDRDTILGALRMLQRALVSGSFIHSDIREICTNSGKWHEPSAEQIDSLCERINMGGDAHKKAIEAALVELDEASCDAAEWDRDNPQHEAWPAVYNRSIAATNALRKLIGLEPVKP